MEVFIGGRPSAKAVDGEETVPGEAPHEGMSFHEQVLAVFLLRHKLFPLPFPLCSQHGGVRRGGHSHGRDSAQAGDQKEQGYRDQSHHVSMVDHLLAPCEG